MPPALNFHLRHALAERIRFYNELGIYDFYRRESAATSSEIQSEQRDQVSSVPVTAETPSETEERLALPKPESGVTNSAAALRLIRDVGMGIVDSIGPARRFFMRHAGGDIGKLPRLMKGEAA